MLTQHATIQGTETFNLTSKITSRDFQISIGLPYEYNELSDRKWGTIFLLDANFYFGMVTEMVRSMAICGATEDAIVVGVGYPTEAPAAEGWRQVMSWRSKDLTPERDEIRETKDSEQLGRVVHTGGGENFLRFIEDELIPLVDRNYRTEPRKRTLAGHSYGGLFTIYAMLQRPRLFQNYVASSPGLHHNGKAILAYEAAFAKRRSTLPASLFMTIGELEENLEFEGVSNFYRFIGQIESRGYRGFTLKKRLFHGEDHCTVASLGFQAGIKSRAADDQRPAMNEK